MQFEVDGRSALAKSIASMGDRIMAVQDQPGLNPVDSLVIDRPEVVARLREDRGRGGPAQGD